MPSFESGYREILSVFNSPCPVFRFHRDEQAILFSRLNEITEISQRVLSPSVRNLMIHNKFVEFLYLLYSMKDQNYYTPSTEGEIKDKIYNITSYIHLHYSEDKMCIRDRSRKRQLFNADDYLRNGNRGSLHR